MVRADPAPPGFSRWPHLWAVLTVCAALPLLFLGAEVTTKGYQLADPKGFRWPWEIIPILWENVWSHFENGEPLRLDLITEHTHRLAGFLVGIFAIALAVSLWRRPKRPGLRWLGTAALACVVVQGLLGKYRVDLHALIGNNLALIHGCFAQLVFGLLVSLVLLTSRGWAGEVEPTSARETRRLARWGLATAGLVYVQIILGALVRRKDYPFGARLHLLTAFAVVAAVVWLVKLAYDVKPRQRGLVGPALFLAGLVFVQLCLGIESWMTRFPAPQWHQARPLPVHPDLFRSLHYFVGSLLFATTLVVTLQAYRRTAPAAQPETAPVGRLEGAL